MRLVKLGLVVALSMQGQDWTEANVVARFLEQNPIAREARARVAVAAAESQGRTLYANPVVAVSREGAGRTEFYQASQGLPVSGRLPLLRQAGVVQGEVLERDGQYLLWQARSLLRGAFYRMLGAQLRGRVYADSQTELDEVIRILRVREREGEGSKLDRMRAEREKVELEAEWSAARTAVAMERGELLGYLPAGTEVREVSGELATAKVEGNDAAWVEKAYGLRADLQADRKRLEHLRLEQRAAERLRIPEPTVNAGFKRADLGQPGLANGPVLGVSWAVPLFNQGKTEVSRFGAEMERVAARLDQGMRRVGAAVKAAREMLSIRNEARDRYASEMGDEMVQIAMLAYQEGEIGILQLLDAYRVRRQARLRLIDLQLAAKDAQIALEAVLGEEISR